MKVLVTGAGGILGRRVVAALTRLIDSIEIVKFRGNLTHPDDVSHNLKHARHFDAVIHLAAMVSVPEVAANPSQAHAVNVAGTINLLNGLQEIGSKPYFLYASSAHIYKPDKGPISENAPKSPISLYGHTKWLGEQVAAQICEQSNQTFCAARIFSLWDEEQKPPYLFGAMKKRFSEEDLNKPFFVHSAGSLRDFSSASQIADIICKLLIQRISGPINVASGKATEIGEFVQSIAPQPLNISTNSVKSNLIADISKLKEALS
jgi:UDP-glucose 4-epimerase/GDP-4-dehydro-6-deoxy-D-mannose reductase